MHLPTLPAFTTPAPSLSPFLCLQPVPTPQPSRPAKRWLELPERLQHGWSLPRKRCSPRARQKQHGRDALPVASTPTAHSARAGRIQEMLGHRCLCYRGCSSRQTLHVLVGKIQSVPGASVAALFCSGLIRKNDLPMPRKAFHLCHPSSNRGLNTPE